MGVRFLPARTNYSLCRCCKWTKQLCAERSTYDPPWALLFQGLAERGDGGGKNLSGSSWNSAPAVLRSCRYCRCALLLLNPVTGLVCLHARRFAFIFEAGWIVQWSV